MCLVLQLLCCTGQACTWTQITGIARLSIYVQILCNHDSNINTGQPSVFTIEGYDAVPDPLQLSSPPLTLTSTSTSSVLTFPTSTIHQNITHASFYLRLLAHDVSGTSCAQDSAVMYYHLNNKGEFIVSNQKLIPVLPVYVQFPLLSPFLHHLMVRGVSLFLLGCPQHMTPHLWRLCGQRDMTLLGDFATALHLRGHLVSSLDASLPHHVTQITPLQSETTLSALLSQVPNSPTYLCISHCSSPVLIAGVSLGP